MTDVPKNRMSLSDPGRTIDLRWTLRDIKAARLKLTPADPNQLEELIARGLVEMSDNVPVLTEAGYREIE
jgi:hypothetical protein